MSVKERNEAIIQSVLQQIKNEAETQRILSGEYLEKYNFMKYMTAFGDVDAEGIPGGLRTAFLVHSIIDLAIAVPLMVSPQKSLEAVGWDDPVDPVATRLVAAALLAGSRSAFKKIDSIESYKSILEIKLIWSTAAIIGLIWSIKQGASPKAYFPLGAFGIFWGIWNYWRWKLSR